MLPPIGQSKLANAKMMRTFYEPIFLGRAGRGMTGSVWSLSSVLIQVLLNWLFWIAWEIMDLLGCLVHFFC
ncbi:hypothetical protein BJX61DRAFT_509357 [Aspergillus egyptiacus]|nr:hypothetical protein BJX61DRAFT_509357 [Aspergillus egyptiacus]